MICSLLRTQKSNVVLQDCHTELEFANSITHAQYDYLWLSLCAAVSLPF